MANHYDRSVERLLELAELRNDLAEAYRRPHQDRAYIADLHQRIGFVMKEADIHATLAVRQELLEIATGLQYQGIRP